MDWLYDLFRSVLASLGLLDLEAKMIFLGLDNAGKTTLLSRLSNRLRSCKPTPKPTEEELVLGRITFKTFDMGGHEVARQIWPDYFIDTDVVVFVVDATDVERFPEARAELYKLLQTDYLQHVPFLILGNKIDLPTAVGEPDLRQALGLHFTTGKAKVSLSDNVRPIEVFMCSFVKSCGYAEGFRWVTQ
eukprot:CAMPEP_0174268790 /NCGR_PEP_ID=MMETSP0439-20130205/38705_1 /TAXON_ID=0 /ORGANISM="Stereomyxa ramosa, Strain Chinc5" /LENGTH=188 /DNA_ID=CAMNT_0015357181 /DNA_START=44 /DNA_END=607 /DNA_ORIENTATION=-